MSTPADESGLQLAYQIAKAPTGYALSDGNGIVLGCFTTAADLLSHMHMLLRTSAGGIVQDVASGTSGMLPKFMSKR